MKKIIFILISCILIAQEVKSQVLIKNDPSFYVSSKDCRPFHYYTGSGWSINSSIYNGKDDNIKRNNEVNLSFLFDNSNSNRKSDILGFMGGNYYSGMAGNFVSSGSEIVIDLKKIVCLDKISFQNFQLNSGTQNQQLDFTFELYSSNSPDGQWFLCSRNTEKTYSKYGTFYSIDIISEIKEKYASRYWKLKIISPSGNKISWEGINYAISPISIGEISFYEATNLIKANTSFLLDEKCAELTSIISGESYLWSTGETTRTIQVCNPGTYTCQVTNTSFTGNQDLFASISITKQGTQDNLPSPNGEVYCIVKNGNTVYYGGDFNSVGSNTGASAGIDLTTGKANTEIPRVDGIVNVSIPDGQNGWYLGGNFTKVGNYTINNLAHINSNNSVDTLFRPEPNASVVSLLLDGQALYVGGEFTSIKGIENKYIAKLLRSTGESFLWNAQCNGIVRTMAFVNGQLACGGDFTSIGGQIRNYLGAVDTLYVQATDWNPNPNNKVFKLYTTTTKLYVGGDFTAISGVSKNYGAGFSLPSMNLDPYNFGANARIHDFLLSNNVLYVAGNFTSIGGQARNYLAALNSLNGVVASFNSNSNGIIKSILISNNSLIVGGAFSNIGNQLRSGLASLNLSNGLALDWNPIVTAIKGRTATVNTVSLNANTVFIGGEFYSIGAVSRNNAAAIDAVTGQILPWNPNTNAIVRAIAADNSAVYLGGDFTTVNSSVSKNRIAQVHPITGIATGWNPGSDNIVNALVLKNGLLYVGGNFGTIGGASRSKVAVLSALTGTASSINPNVNGVVNALSLSGDTLYIGGEFTSVGGQSRNRIAAYKTSTNTLLEFNPLVDGTVNALASIKNNLYLGGTFANVGGVLRNNLAEIDINTGLTTELNTNIVNGYRINALGVQDSSLYLGGQFQYSNSGYPISNLATVKTQSQLLGYWQPEPDGIIRTLCVASDKIYVGGGFKQINGRFQPYFASLDVYLSGNKPEVTSVTPLTTCAKAPISIKGKGFKAIESVKIGQTVVPFTVVSDTVISIQPENTLNGAVSVSNILGFGKGNQNLNVINLSTTKIEYTQPAALCTGTTKLLNAPFFDGATYQWKKNGVAISGATNSTFSVNSAGSYSLSTSLGSACKSDAPAVSISVESAPAVTISGPSKICWNGRAMFRASVAYGVWAPVDNTLILASPQGLFRNGVKPATDNYKSGVSYTVSSKLKACTTKVIKNVYVRNVIAPSITISTLKSSIKVNESTTATATTNILASGTWSSTNTLVSAIANPLNTKTATVKGLRVGSGANVVYFADDATTGCRNAGYLAYSVTAAASMVSVSTNSETATSNTSLYPNPSNGKFTLYSTEGVNSVKLIDISGRVIAVRPIAASTTTIDFTGVSSGKYMLQITGDQVNEMQPIVIE